MRAKTLSTNKFAQWPPKKSNMTVRKLLTAMGC